MRIRKTDQNYGRSFDLYTRYIREQILANKPKKKSSVNF